MNPDIYSTVSPYQIQAKHLTPDNSVKPVRGNDECSYVRIMHSKADDCTCQLLAPGTKLKICI